MATNTDIDQDKNNLLTMNRNLANVCPVPMTGAQATVFSLHFAKTELEPDYSGAECALPRHSSKTPRQIRYLKFWGCLYNIASDELS